MDGVVSASPAAGNGSPSAAMLEAQQSQLARHHQTTPALKR
jgi:hypothetical protein